jgi:hypothetical protein
MQLSHALRQCRCQRRLTMIYVANRANVHMGLISLKFFFRHDLSCLSKLKKITIFRGL